MEKRHELFILKQQYRFGQKVKIKTQENNNNNNNNNYYYYYYYLLQLGCYPLAVVILHVYKI